MKTTIISIFCLVSCVFSFRTQSVAVCGKLRCGDKDASNVVVKLVDQDHGPDPDDYLDSIETNSTGHFFLKGSTSELSSIDPEIKIYHDCNDKKTCQREWTIRIPSNYIFDGEVAESHLNIGTLNLELQMERERRRCPDAN